MRRGKEASFDYPTSTPCVETRVALKRRKLEPLRNPRELVVAIFLASTVSSEITVLQKYEKIFSSSLMDERTLSPSRHLECEVEAGKCTAKLEYCIVKQHEILCFCRLLPGVNTKLITGFC